MPTDDKGATKDRRLVLITWVDSYGCSSSWEDLEDCKPKKLTCRSVGWLIHDGDECKVIVPHISDIGDQGCGDMTIPTLAIISTRDLK